MSNRRMAIHTLREALAKGATPDTPWTADWDVSGDCLMPVARSIAPPRERTEVRRHWAPLLEPEAYRDQIDLETGEIDQIVTKIGHAIYTDNVGPIELRLMVPCRKCDKCLKRRQLLWGRRAVQEVKLSARTWTSSLTLSPQWHEHFANLARLRCVRRGNGVMEEHPLADQFLFRHAEINREITKMFKRMRKGIYDFQGGRRPGLIRTRIKRRLQFRYLLVVEPHLSSHLDDDSEEKGANYGLPHYHILVNEIGAEIPKRILQNQWKWGFSHFRLVDKTDMRRVWYVCKYLGKTSASRVRSSLTYGFGSSLEEGILDKVSVDKTDLKNEAEPGQGTVLPAAFTRFDYLNCSQGA